MNKIIWNVSNWFKPAKIYLQEMKNCHTQPQIYENEVNDVADNNISDNMVSQKNTLLQRVLGKLGTVIKSDHHIFFIYGLCKGDSDNHPPDDYSAQYMNMMLSNLEDDIYNADESTLEKIDEYITNVNLFCYDSHH